MSDKLMTLIDRYADLVYKSRTEPVSKYELREYDAIRCRMDIEGALSEARSQAFEESAKIAERRVELSSEVSTAAAIAMLQALPEAIRQHPQKGKDK